MGQLRLLDSVRSLSFLWSIFFNTENAVYAFGAISPVKKERNICIFNPFRLLSIKHHMTFLTILSDIDKQRTHSTSIFATLYSNIKQTTQSTDFWTFSIKQKTQYVSLRVNLYVKQRTQSKPTFLNIQRTKSTIILGLNSLIRQINNWRLLEVNFILKQWTKVMSFRFNINTQERLRSF
jgi:hypothetical protein